MKTRTVRRNILISFLLTLFFCLFAPGASANSWGLRRGALLSSVANDSRWNEYTTLCSQAGDYAVMGARYHSALFYAEEDGTLHIYTRAVYQPGEGAERPEIQLKNGRLTLRYGEKERYTFEDALQDGTMTLTEASVRGFTMTLDLAENEDGYAYRAKKGGEQALLIQKITLPDFNIHLLPKSVKEVRHHNEVMARLDSGLDCLGIADTEGHAYSPDNWGNLLENSKTGTVPVYSAPFDGAWRAAKGKAAVGLNGDVWHLFSYKNAKGESYACIRYFVSQRTQRIGYIRCEDAGLPAVGEQSTRPGESFTKVKAQALQKTYITDDPDVSQFRHFDIKKGTSLTVLGLYNNDYAYVQMEGMKDKKGKPIQTLWGFVPIRDIAPEKLPAQKDAIQKLVGSWTFNAGGSMADDHLTFREDGTFNEGGTWYVTAYDPQMNLYWDNPRYELTLLYKDGRVIVRGLSFDENGFGLTYWEGGGGYVPGDTAYGEADHG